jgi:murein tripeptide amidase MpaA
MILYNVTVSIDQAIEQQWAAYMREIHIPEVMQTGCFLESRFCRVHGEEEGGVTYATTYLAINQETYDDYLAKHAAKLRDEFNAKWAGNFAAFRTLLTVVEEFKQA